MHAATAAADDDDSAHKIFIITSIESEFCIKSSNKNMDSKVMHENKSKKIVEKTAACMHGSRRLARHAMVNECLTTITRITHSLFLSDTSRPSHQST